jgi:hypothetical protein
MGPKKLFSKLTSKVLSRGPPEPVIDNFTIWDSQPDARSDVFDGLARLSAHAPVSACSGEHFDLETYQFAQSIGAPKFDTGIASLTRFYERRGFTNDDHEPTSRHDLSIADIRWDVLNQAQSQHVIDRCALKAAPEHLIRRIDWAQLDERQTQDVVSSFSETSLFHEQETPLPPESPDQHPMIQFDQPSPVDSASSFGEPHVPYSGKGKGRIRDFDLGQSQSFHSAADSFGPMQDILNQELQLKKEMARKVEEWQDQMNAIKARKDAELERQRQRHQDKLRLLEMQRKRALQLEREEGLGLRAALVLQEEQVRECLHREEEERRLVAEAKAKLEEEEWLAAQLASMRDCVVCGDSKSPLDFPINAPTLYCEHPPQTCAECLQTWITSELGTKGCQGLTCSQCPQILQYPDVQRSASEDAFTAYENILTRDALSQLPEFVWCLAAGCGAGQLHVQPEGTLDAMMECHSCKYVQCLKHKCAWHHGETCRQYDYRSSGQQARDEERATEAMLNDISKKCPGENCGWRIQKSDGCDHMTCRRCKHQFCWQCMAPHAEIKRVGNTAHLASCKFHSDNLTPDWPFNVH